MGKQKVDLAYLRGIYRLYLSLYETLLVDAGLESEGQIPFLKG